jgi:hypothetical protein
MRFTLAFIVNGWLPEIAAWAAGSPESAAAIVLGFFAWLADASLLWPVAALSCGRARVGYS